ncbi:ABC transporter substrate-binding protein/permease [Gemmatimonas sp.]|uniref:ABC transporter substrate-binding protein/permease n=1 Tax=Gemmatimonas sp. TaxID=1962908 RepID=UPI00286E7569|nr:ABC transporter substrate-binding protein/permease [Gemmatimonas sp.]
MIRFATRLLSLAALLVGTWACTSPPDARPVTRPPLRWGGDAEGGAPFVEADAADPTRVRGFDVEIAAMIAQGLGRKPEFVQVAWASIEQSVARGDFTIGMSGLEDRPALHERFAVSLPYYEFREVLAVRAADSARFHTLADLGGRRVATLGSTMAWEMVLAAKIAHGVLPVSYDDDVHPYTDLVSGRVDAVLLDHVLAERSLRRIGGFVIQPAALARGHYVAVLAAGDSVLRDSVNATLRARMRDGALERVFRSWDVWNASQSEFQQRVLQDSVAARDASAATRGTTTSIATYLPALLRAAMITLALSVLAMTLAIVIGIGLAAGRVYGSRPLRILLTAYVEIIRGTPVLLQLFVLYYGLSDVVRLPAFAAAVIGLGLNYAAYESEIYRAALEAIPTLQLEAARTLGLSEVQILRLVRGPQALRLALAPMTNDFVALLKDSSLVSVITVVELTKQTAIYATNAGSWAIPGALCAIVYLSMSLPLSRMARRLEQRWTLS